MPTVTVWCRGQYGLSWRRCEDNLNRKDNLKSVTTSKMKTNSIIKTIKKHDDLKNEDNPKMRRFFKWKMTHWGKRPSPLIPFHSPPSHTTPNPLILHQWSFLLLIFNEQKLVLGLQHVKVQKVQMEKFKNIGSCLYRQMT